LSYQASADLAKDPAFHGRVGACLNTEARAKPAEDQLATEVLRDTMRAAYTFMPYLSTAPGFDATYEGGGQAAITDGQILSATQAAWPLVAARMTAV